MIGKGRLIADISADEFVRSSSRQSVHVRSPSRPSWPPAAAIACMIVLFVLPGIAQALLDRRGA